MSTGTDTRTRWGRARFGGGRIPALAIAIPIGLVLAAAVGAITLWTGVASGDRGLLVAGVFALVMSWGLVGLVWALVVDRTTLTGAIDEPEQSVESAWLDAAMAGGLRDTILLTGAVLAILAITGLELSGTWALSGVIVVAAFSVAVRYLIARKRG